MWGRIHQKNPSNDVKYMKKETCKNNRVYSKNETVCAQNDI